MVKRGLKVPVSQRALVARITRKLAAQDDPEYLRASRSEPQRKKLGDWYVVDSIGHVVYDDLDLEKFGRMIGVLKAFEEVFIEPQHTNLGWAGPKEIEEDSDA